MSLKRLILLLLISAVWMESGSALYPFYQRSASQNLAIKDKIYYSYHRSLPLYHSPRKQAKRIKVISYKECVLLLKYGKPYYMGRRRGRWVQVRAEQGYVGWCFSGYLARITKVRTFENFINRRQRSNRANQLTPLMVAASLGANSLIKILLDRGALVNAKSGACTSRHSRYARTVYKWTALLFACESGLLETAKLLIKAGAKIEWDSKGQRNPLIHAAASGSIPLVKYLMQRGVSYATYGRYSEGILLLAARPGNLKMVEWLLSKTKVRKELNRGWRSPLIPSIEKNDFAMVKLLFKYGVDPNLLDNRITKREGVFYHAIRTGHPEIIKMLFDKKVFYVKRKEYRPHGKSRVYRDTSLLERVLRRGYFRVAKHFIKRMTEKVFVTQKLGVCINVAVESGRSDVAHMILERAKDIDADLIDGGQFWKRFKIHTLVKFNEKKMVETFLDKGASVNAKTKYSYHSTPLMVAVKQKNIEMVRYLLDKDADVNVADSMGLTALFYARDLRIIKALLDKGAKIRSLNLARRVAVHRLGGKEFSILRFLIKKGANLNSTTRYGYSFLERVYRYGSNSHLLMVLKTGLDYTGSHNEIFYDIALGKYNKLQKYLSKNDILQDISTLNETLIMCAARFNRIKILRLLLKRGDYKNRYGQTALMSAAKYGSLKAVQFLLSKGAKINMRDITTTALGRAVAKGHYRVAKFLISKGANVHAKSQWGSYKCSFLIEAVQKKDLRLVKLMLKHKVNIESAYVKRRPLHYALWDGNEKIVLCLLKHGAKVDVVNERGDTPLYYACKRFKKKKAYRLVKMLLKYRTASNKRKIRFGGKALLCAVKKKYKEVVRLLLQHGVDPNIFKFEGRSILMLAASTGDLDIVKMLVEKGARLDQEYWYRTPLIYAMMHDYPKIEKYLRAKGAE